ncbi:hypothetical protein EV356DRAFT_533172 [Viridothelium virens]|uniref:CHAT domain-containing protein n=1 Tax=Viridothelium virens TaxID=1048519 RepID=A0A6A6H8B6_VIRVR|nr:hypothetical protein EV356DRAFT_533172 [Viridothelium virens]
MDTTGDLALYYPDSSITSPHIRDVIAHLQRFCLRAEWKEGKAYISSLQEHDLRNLSIAGCAILLHLQHGNYSGAKELLQKVRIEELLSEEHALLREEVAVLALLSAEVESASNFKIEEALNLSQEVEQIYMFREWDFEADFSSQESRDRANIILKQRSLWKLDDPEAYDDLETPFPNSRVIIENLATQVYHRAHFAGFPLPEAIKTRLRARIPSLIKFLRARNRRLLEAYVIFESLPSPNTFVSSPVETMTFWQGYLETLTDKKLSLIRASVLGQLIAFHAEADNEAALHCSEQSSRLFEQEHCVNHLTDSAMSKWQFLSKVSSAAEEKSGQHSIDKAPPVSSDSVLEQIDGMTGALSLKDKSNDAKTRRSVADAARRRLEQLFSIQAQQLQGDQGNVLHNCLREAIFFTKKFPELWPYLKMLMDPGLALLRSYENHYSARVIEYLYFIECGDMIDYADEARIFFHATLSRGGPELTPDFFVGACKGAWRSNSMLEDHKTALTYAQQDYDSPLCLRNELRRTEAAWRLARSQVSIASARIAALRYSSDQVERAALRREMENIVVFLETWIELDRKASRSGGHSEKADLLASVLTYLCNDLQVKEYEEKWQNHINSTYTKSKPDENTQTRIRLAPMMLMLGQNRFLDMLRYAADMQKEVMNNKSLSLSMVSVMSTAVALALQSAALFKPPLPEEMRKQIRTIQYDFIMSDLKVLKFNNSAEIFLLRAPLLMWTTLDSIKLWPERKDEYIESMVDYFDTAQSLCRRVRRNLESDVGLQQWIRRRSVGGKFTFSRVCQYAGEFFLKSKKETLAWSWIQRGRAQALQDMLRDRNTAVKRIFMTLNGDSNISRYLSEEEQLVKSMAEAGPALYFENRRKLDQHREQMRKHPALQQILDGPEDVEQVEYDNLHDVWALAEYLPKDSNIVLVDWFIDTMNKIWRVAVNYKERHLTPRYWRLSITPQQISFWVTRYLRFPNGSVAPLENKLKALHALRNLFFGLEGICKPDDLLILNVPGALAGIPVHGIPFDGEVLIERNPVIYSAGLNLYRQCLKRARQPVLVNDGHPLQDAVFTSAYGEAGYEAEQDRIFSHLKETASVFRSTSLLGDQLTVKSMHDALDAAPWIHYHGHAYYAKTEMLNQCLVLGSLKEEEKKIQSRDHRSIVEETRAQLNEAMPFEAPLTEREALLSNHLLDGTSRLTIADIFAMDLSKTHPVVCSIACDSGVQDFAAGDEPLGLVSALFCAGASSVIGTLWPIRSSTGRMFSEAFYKNLEEQGKYEAKNERNQLCNVLNLAQAFREATITVKRAKSDPYSWAPFVLQGAGFYFYERSGELDSREAQNKTPAVH